MIIWHSVNAARRRKTVLIACLALANFCLLALGCREDVQSPDRCVTGLGLLEAVAAHDVVVCVKIADNGSAPSSSGGYVPELQLERYLVQEAYKGEFRPGQVIHVYHHVYVGTGPAEGVKASGLNLRRYGPEQEVVLFGTTPFPDDADTVQVLGDDPVGILLVSDDGELVTPVAAQR